MLFGKYKLMCNLGLTAYKKKGRFLKITKYGERLTLKHETTEDMLFFHEGSIYYSAE